MQRKLGEFPVLEPSWPEFRFSEQKQKSCCNPRGLRCNALSIPFEGECLSRDVAGEESSHSKMADIGISEFTFGYAFLYEQTQANWGDLKAAPVLPSLKQEEEEGWDARLPLNATDFYYQFKLSEHLSRGNATYLKDGTYNTPYYRVWLHRRDGNRQHRRLRQHCIENPNTFYVAPEFNSLEYFHERFLARQITQNCRIIPLTDCNEINDGERHCFTFQQGDPAWILHSEPNRRETSYSGHDLEKLYRQTVSRWERVDLHFAERLYEKTRDLARRLVAEEEPVAARIARPLLDVKPHRERRDLLLRTADILSAVLGVTLVLVGT
jgi:hypothetical protein